MVGVKGYDAKILDVLSRHKIWIVSKATNANTITHYLKAPLQKMKRVERDICEAYPNAEIKLMKLAVVAVIGRDLSGLEIVERGLGALREGGVRPLAVQHVPGSADVQFIVEDAARDPSIKLLHAAFVENKAAKISILAA